MSQLWLQSIPISCGKQRGLLEIAVKGPRWMTLRKSGNCLFVERLHFTSRFWNCPIQESFDSIRLAKLSIWCLSVYWVPGVLFTAKYTALLRYCVEILKALLVFERMEIMLTGWGWLWTECVNYRLEKFFDDRSVLFGMRRSDCHGFMELVMIITFVNRRTDKYTGEPDFFLWSF